MLHRLAPDPVLSERKRALSLTEQAYTALRHRIITCQMPPGLEVSELDLAEQLQMSKTPVREALARLGIEGFVETFPRRGYRIMPVTVKDINDLFVVRGTLEGGAAALAAKTMSDGDIDALEVLAKATYTPGETVSVEPFIKANDAFHTAIARSSGVPRLSNLIVSHLEEATRLFYMGAQIRDVNPETTEDHHRIVDILRRRDSAKARDALIAHNENTRRGLLASLVAEGNAGLTL